MKKARPWPVDESELPVRLPDLEDFQPAKTGESPLANATDWLVVEKDGKTYRRDTNTMPQWAGSCWYYLRYLDPNNDQAPWDKAKEKYWMPVDLYVGGAEHAVLHLLVLRGSGTSSFSIIGWVSTKEPFQKLFNQGMILSFAYKDSRGAYVNTHDIDFSGDKPKHKTTGEVARRVGGEDVQVARQRDQSGRGRRRVRGRHAAAVRNGDGPARGHQAVEHPRRLRRAPVPQPRLADDRRYGDGRAASRRSRTSSRTRTSFGCCTRRSRRSPTTSRRWASIPPSRP